MRKIKVLIIFLLLIAPLTFQIESVNAEPNLPTRNINIYIVNIPNIIHSKIYNPDNIYQGVLTAVSESESNTPILLFNDIYNIHIIDNLHDFQDLVFNPPRYAIIVNTHGETLPIPNVYAQNDANSGGDAIDFRSSSAYTILPRVTYHGYLEEVEDGWDKVDYYKFYGEAGDVVDIYLQVPNADFDVALISPTGVAYGVGSGPGGGYIENVVLDRSGYWYIKVYKVSGYGFYDLYFTKQSGGGGGGGGCPFLYTWNGSDYIVDNNILPLSEINYGDVGDYYVLRNELVYKDTKRKIYSVLIGEPEDEITYLDQIEIYSVYHPENTSIAVDDEGNIYLIRNPRTPIEIIENSYNGVLDLVSRIDNLYFEGTNGDVLTFNFGKINSTTAKLVIRADYKVPLSVFVQVMDLNGIWHTIHIIEPRKYWSTYVIMLVHLLILLKTFTHV